MLFVRPRERKIFGWWLRACYRFTPLIKLGSRPSNLFIFRLLELEIKVTERVACMTAMSSILKWQRPWHWNSRQTLHGGHVCGANPYRPRTSEIRHSTTRTFGSWTSRPTYWKINRSASNTHWCWVTSEWRAITPLRFVLLDDVSVAQQLFPLSAQISLQIRGTASSACQCHPQRRNICQCTF